MISARTELLYKRVVDLESAVKRGDEEMAILAVKSIKYYAVELEALLLFARKQNNHDKKGN